MTAQWVSDPTWHNGEETYDIKPIKDLKPHSDGPDCWCKPLRHDGSSVFVHNSMDRREDYETGKVKAH